MITENANVMCIPTMNGSLIRFGKNVCPDRYAAWLAVSVCSEGPSKRRHRVVSEERREQRSNRRQIRHLVRHGGDTPCAVKPANIVDGSVELSPAIISEKKMPIDSVMPLFWNVASIPDATPRRSARHGVHHARSIRRDEHSHR